MTLNKLEQAVLIRFFESEGFGKISCDLNQATIIDRRVTGTGFVTQLIPNQLIVLNGPRSFTGGHVGATINSNVEVGFLFFIKEGYLDVIEGYTYEEDWPDEIRSFELYLIDFPSGQKRI